MRRVDAEGDLRGVRGQQQDAPRSRSRLRRAAIEWLERRELLSTSTSTLPSPTVLSPPNIATLTQTVSFAAGNPLINSPTEVANANSPSVSADPLNPSKLVATWVDHDVTGFNPGGFNQRITNYIAGAYSTDGGKTWAGLQSASGVDVQVDFSQTFPTNGTINVFTQTTDASVGFDRNENFYILSTSHNDANTAGVLDLQRFGFAGASPTKSGTTAVYSWDGPDGGATGDAVVTPTLAVDTNVPSFTDPTTGVTQADPYSGNIYAVWGTVDSNTFFPIPNFNANAIRMAASSNQGVNFTHAAYVDDSSNANFGSHQSVARYSAPQVAISQGAASVSPGQVTIVYDDSTTEAPLDRILVQDDQVGGTAAVFTGPARTPINIATVNPVSGQPDIPATTDIPFNVTVNDPNFTTLQALDVTLRIQYPNMAELSAVLIPPAGSGLGNVTLFTNGVNGLGTAFAPPRGITGNSLGIPADLSTTAGGGTVFDSEAIRGITDGNSKPTSYVGHYQPEFGGLSALQGATIAQLTGTWTLEITSVKNQTTFSVGPTILAPVLNFTSGLNPGLVKSTGQLANQVTVADINTAFIVNVPNINPSNSASSYGTVTHTANSDGIVGTAVSGSGDITAPTQGGAILPAPVIASDNTLGSFSAHQGRIYVAFTGTLYDLKTRTLFSQAGNTDVFLLFSDNGGRSWSNATQVNDDNAATDGFSGSTAGGPLGRAQYQPQVAVDQSTGTLVVSFLDARNDPSNARVATYIAASSDGGSTFAADVYANPSQTATDAVTGNPAVNLGPIPDNESAAGTLRDTSGYGTHQALAVVNGRIIPFWASNENSAKLLPGQAVPRPLTIVDSILSLAAGPRIISSTQGPVGQAGDVQNTARAADGTTLANTIVVTFDRPVDPSSFLTGNVNVFYEAPTGGAQVSLPVTAVVPLAVTALGAYQFKITFNPAGLPTFVGTYSYVIKPNGISDRIRHVIGGGAIANGNVMDQNGNGTPGEPPVLNSAGTSFRLPGDDYVAGQPTTFTNYATGTLPLIVPGPHVSSTSAIDSTGKVISSGTNNLVLNNTVGALQVTFDRNINVGSFTPAQILGIFGPAGAVALAGLTITPLTVFTPGGQVMYAGGATADAFKVTFATQQLSGTYAVTMGTGITSADGSGIDASLNAGLDVLKGVATNGITVPVSYASTSVPSTIQPATVNQDGSVTPSVLMAPISVPDNFPIQGDNTTTNVSGITLTLSVTYPNDPDLVAYLLAPDGVTKVNLFTNVGAGTNTANFTSTTLSDTASTSIDKAGAPFFGTFLPEAPFSNLGPSGAALNSQGIWTLVIQNAGNSSGTLTNWSLTFRKPVSSTGLAEFPNDQTTTSFQIFNLASTNPLANSTWTAVGPAGITTTGATTPVSYAASLAPVPATIAPAVGATPTVTSSPIIVPDNFPLLGDNGNLAGITLTLNILSNKDSDLSAFLLAPDGVTRINLFTNIGSGANFIGTTFNDTAATSIDSSNSPFNGSFKPETPFSTLSGVSKLSSLGTWTLVITNKGTSSGLLAGWSLTFQKAAATLAGAVSSVAVDPSDTTGNTVYIGTASGGVWKTTDFLTPNPSGPTYVPLTDFGPNFAQNIGSIAVFGRNNDPAQSIIFAGSGFGQERTNSTNGSPNTNGNTGEGGGLLRSMDGGKTWEVVGNFAGMSTYKIVVDPKPNLNGQAVVFAAMGGPYFQGGGLYRSLDSGNTWTLLAAGNATDVLLDPNSKSPTTGNLDTLYVAFSNPTSFVGNGTGLFPEPVGIYVSTNQGQTLQPVNGGLGKDPLLVSPGFPAQPLTVLNSTGVTPNNPNSAYIVLGKPALTGNIAENLAYQGFLYAAVENYNGTFQGLYVTKDAGENWTLVQLPNIPGNLSVKASVPTNDTTGANSYDPTSSHFTSQGAYDLTLTVDPTNPNIVYLGGSKDFQGSGMIRVNLTDLFDAHNVTSGSNERTDGGLLFLAAQGGTTIANNVTAKYTPLPPGQPQDQFLNLRYAPNNGTPGTSPFNINATLVVANAVNIINDGTGVTWSAFDEPLRAQAGDATATTNLHQVINYVDPITGDVRMLFADDLGVFTALVNPDGTLNYGIGSDVAPNYSRNGNLQDEQFLTSAAQPSLKASTQAGAEFYSSGKSTIAAQSDPNVLTDGNLTWDNSSVLSAPPSSPRSTAGNNSISSSDRSGVGIATDQTGGVSSSNPSGTPSIYEFDIPILGGNLTDFFRVNQFGQTTGLVSNVNQDFPANGYDGDAHQGGVLVNPVTNLTPSSITGAITNGQIPLGVFQVNPLNGNQIIITSATGNVYETTNQGILWQPIGNSTNFGSLDAIAQAPSIDNGKFVGQPGRVNPLTIQVSAVAYGAPDPNASGGVGNLNNFIYVGTTGISYTPVDPATMPSDPYIDLNDGLLYNDAKIFVTQAGGAGWLNVSSGLDGSSIVGIYPDPDRGSHAAYAVTLTGVFFSPDTVGLAQSGKTVWTNITSNLKSLTYDAFNNPAYQQSVLAGFAYIPANLVIPPPMGTPNLAPPQPYNSVYDGHYGGFTGIVADYRYQIPAATNATQGTNIFFPVLYASGYGGVFRSVDNGVTWTVFPDQNFDSAPVDGGYLPNVDVTNLQLVLGNINPDTGHAVQATGDPEVLLASTYGRGDFAIRLAPDVIPASIKFDAALPAPDGSDSSGVGITNVLEPFLDGVSEVSNFGNTVTINLFDQSRNPDGTPTAGFGTLLGTGTTNALGQFVVQLINSGQDPTFFVSSTAFNDKVVGVRATDSAGASGNLTLFHYTLDLINPNTPDAPVLEPTYDTGRSTTDGLTNLSVPAQAGPGAPLTIVTPTFDVVTPLPQANPLSPNPISLTVELLRGATSTGPFFVIDSTQTGFVNSGGTAETYMLTDSGLATMAAAGIHQTFYYEALQIDEAGNVSNPASNVESVTVNTIAPVAPTGITLVSMGTTSPPMPTFSVAGVLPNDQVLLYRSINNQAPILVGTGAINATTGTVTLPVTDTAGASPDGVYTYFAAQLDVYGNFSPLTAGLQVIVNTQTPPAAPVLEPKYDTGRSNSDDVTDIAIPAPTPGSAPNYVVPVFDVTTVPPTAGQPAIATVELFRANAAGGPYTMVGSSAFGGNPAMVTDATLQSLVSAGPINQVFYYEADQINAAGIVSSKSPALAVTVDTITPPTLPAATLDPASNTGLIKTQLITNITKPTFDATSLLPGEQLFLYRSSGGKPAILVGTGPINTTSSPLSTTVTDTLGAVPDGVYQYYVVQQDLAGNISNFSQAIAVTINTTTPAKPTIALLTSDDTGLPSHPNVTSVNMPHFVGTAQYNSGTNFPVAIINVATGAVLGMSAPAANGTYLAQILAPLPDGVYTLEARTTNLAGTSSFSAPLVVTIKHTGPQQTPTLQISNATDTGIKGDGVTSIHAPVFVGTTDPGVSVSLYVLLNGTVMGPYATTTSSTLSGAFSFQLPFNLTNGTTQLIAQASDIANNKGNFSPPFAVRISTTPGDYLGLGFAQLTVFDPYNETYYVRNTGSAQVDYTTGRDVPIQYDFNGDGVTDLTAYRFNTSEFYGYVSNNTGIDLQYGVGGQSLPVSGYYGNSGTYINGIYIPSIGVWALGLPQPGGLVLNFGIPKLDVPTPAAFDGFGSTELAVFRPSNYLGGDADSFTVIGPTGQYMVSFASPAAQKLGFVYKPGDIPAPADYDGVGRDEFAVYRPSTGQFFILNTPSRSNTATWTLRTVNLNLPGGPKAGDEPVSQDYDGTGKVDPAVYRPSNSTFYIIHGTTGLQSNIQYQPVALGNSQVFVAAAGPVVYRLTALLGSYASNGGYGLSNTGGGGGGTPAAIAIGSTGGGTLHAASVAPPATGTTPAPASPLATMIAVATPLPITTAPAPSAPAATPAAATAPVTVGAPTPRVYAPASTGSKVATSHAGHLAASRKATKPLLVDSRSHEAAALAKAHVAKAHATTPAKGHATTAGKAATATDKARAHATTAALAATSLQHLVMAKKGRKKG